MTKINLAGVVALVLVIIALLALPQAQAKSETTLRQQGRGSVLFVEAADVSVVPPVQTAPQRIAATPVRITSATSWYTRHRVSRSTWIKAQHWAKNPIAWRITWCESKHHPKAVNPTGKYRGAWQMDRHFWRTYGGLKFARLPDKASLSAQNYVAYRGYKARGYSPWRGSCSGIR